jgi:hypothetical protein
MRNPGTRTLFSFLVPDFQSLLQSMRLRSHADWLGDGAIVPGMICSAGVEVEIPWVMIIVPKGALPAREGRPHTYHGIADGQY